MIKLAPRAIIDDAFWDVVIDIYKKIYKVKKQRAELDSRFNRPGNSLPIMARLLPIIDGVSDGRSGADYEMTRFRILPYQQFSALNYRDKIWLIGKTNPVIIHYEDRDYHMGPYKVCVRAEDIQEGSMTDIQFVPLRNVKGKNRHPHHHAGHHYDGVSHPLSAIPSTCWGNYGAIIASLMTDGDIPEFFRQLYIYLTRYNAASPLILNGIRGVSFETDRPWVQE